MKTYIYWGSTLLVALAMLASGVAYFAVESMADNFARLGFPQYFRVQLGIAKIIGAAALVTPLPRAVKEWTYAGFGITFLSAVIAHLSAGDPVSTAVAPTVAFGLLATSYWSYRQRLNAGSQEGTA